MWKENCNTYLTNIKSPKKLQYVKKTNYKNRNAPHQLTIMPSFILGNFWIIFFQIYASTVKKITQLHSKKKLTVIPIPTLINKQIILFDEFVH